MKNGAQLATLAAIVLAACQSPRPAIVLGCSTSADCLAGQVCDPSGSCVEIDSGPGLDAGESDGGGLDAGGGDAGEPDANGTTDGGLSDAGPGDGGSGCVLQPIPPSVQFNDVVMNNSKSLNFEIKNDGDATCLVDVLTISGPPFTISNPGIPTLPFTLEPRQSVMLQVTFAPRSVAPAMGEIDIETEASTTPLVVELTGNGVATGTCRLTSDVSAVEFPYPAPTFPAMENLDLVNKGSDPCDIVSLSFIPASGASASDFSATVVGAQPGSVTTVEPGSSVMVQVVEEGTTAAQYLSLEVDYGDSNSDSACTGCVAAGTCSSACTQLFVPVVVANACTAAGITITATEGGRSVLATGILQGSEVTLTATDAQAGTIFDYEWAFVTAPTGNMSALTPSGAAATLDCTTPGSYNVEVLEYGTGGCAFQTIPLTVVTTPPACASTPQGIFLMDSGGALYQFDPGTTMMTSLGQIQCNDPLATVNTMAVDRQGTAWVEYTDGSLFRVETASLTCTATAFSPSATTSSNWGACFAIDSVGGSTATFYIAESGKLQTIDTTTLAVTTIGSLMAPGSNVPELTATASAELYGLFPGSPWVLAQINRTSAAVLSQTNVNALATAVPTPENWAFAAWGSDFWFFVGDGTSTDIFRYNASTGATTMVTTTSAIIVGAGAPPCGE